MSLNEKEQQIWQSFVGNFDNEPYYESQARRGFLQEAEKVNLDSLARPFSATMVLSFDEGRLFLRLMPWIDGQAAVIPDRPILAKVEALSLDRTECPGVNNRGFILLRGPSVDGVRNPGFVSSVARNCNLSYSSIESRPIDDAPALSRFYAKINPHRGLRESIRLEELRQQGLVRMGRAGEFEIQPSSEIYELPPVRELYIPNQDSEVGF